MKITQSFNVELEFYRCAKCRRYFAVESGEVDFQNCPCCANRSLRDVRIERDAAQFSLQKLEARWDRSKRARRAAKKAVTK